MRVRVWTRVFGASSTETEHKTVEVCVCQNRRQKKCRESPLPSITRELKMDLFIWLCGCVLALLSPPAVTAEEGGRFDTLAARSCPCHVGDNWKLTRSLQEQHLCICAAAFHRVTAAPLMINLGFFSPDFKPNNVMTARRVTLSLCPSPGQWQFFRGSTGWHLPPENTICYPRFATVFIG